MIKTSSLYSCLCSIDHLGSIHTCNHTSLLSINEGFILETYSLSNCNRDDTSCEIIETNAK